MKLYLKNLLCIVLATSSECKAKLLIDIAGYVYNLISLGLDVGDRLKSDDQLEKVQESLNKLEEAIDRVHSMIEYTKEKVDDLNDLIIVQSYYDSSERQIQKINRCLKDLRHLFNDPMDVVARENLRKCYDIIINAEVIGGYLSGRHITGSKPLFDYFYNEDGSCKGEERPMELFMPSLSMDAL